jgi:Spy/CpxP family protein refolding chaperone
MALLGLAFVLPGLLLLLYSKMVIESALVKREIESVVREQHEIIKKNQALKSAIASLSRELRNEGQQERGQSAQIRNRIVRLEVSGHIAGPE